MGCLPLAVASVSPRSENSCSPPPLPIRNRPQAPPRIANLPRKTQDPPLAPNVRSVPSWSSSSCPAGGRRREPYPLPKLYPYTPTTGMCRLPGTTLQLRPGHINNHLTAFPAASYRLAREPSPAKSAATSLLDPPSKMPYSGHIGTDPALKSPSTRLPSQRFSSTEFWRRLRAAKTLKSLACPLWALPTWLHPEHPSGAPPGLHQC